MPIDNDSYAPYASPSNVLTVVRQERSKGLPTTVDPDYLGRLGIAEGLRMRTIQALKFLGVLDGEGHPTPELKRLGVAPDDEYPALLAEMVRQAYHAVFAVVDPSSATDIQLGNAFRSYNPRAQQPRMIALFVGLCKEAGLSESIDKPVTAAPGPPKIRKFNANSGKSVSPSVSSPNEQNAPPSALNIDWTRPLLAKLPSTGKWTTRERDKWTAALNAAIDLFITVSDEESD